MEVRIVLTFLWIAGLSLALTSGMAAGAAGKQAPPNVLLISLDSARADHLSSYGYFRRTSPNLDRLAADGLRFTSFFSVAGWTLPAHTSLHTGLDPVSHGLLGFKDAGKRLPPPAPILVRSLKAAGYVTGGLAGENVVFGFAPAFVTDMDFRKGNIGNRDGQSMRPLVEEALAWIKQQKSQPFFLYIHTNDIHTRGFFPDYSTAPEFLSKWTSDPNPRLPGRTPEEQEKIKAQYDGCISFVDHWLGVLFESLKQQGLEENTLVVIVSDHGDLLWDQGPFFGHAFLYDSTLRSVLLMRWPGRLPAGKVLDCLSSQSDIAPTILDLIGLPPLEEADGQSLVPVIRGQESEVRTEVSAWTENQRCLRTREWKLVVSQIPEDKPSQAFQYLKTRLLDGEELYDLGHDPGEKKNLAQERPEIAKKLRQRLLALEQAGREKAQRLGI